MKFFRAEFKSAESLLSCILHMSGVTAIRKPKVTVSKPAINQNFDVFRFFLVF